MGTYRKFPKFFIGRFNLQYKYNVKLNPDFMSIKLAHWIFIFLFNLMK